MFQTQDVFRIEYNLYRILNGFYYIEDNNINYKIIYPSIKLKYKAQELFIELIEDNKFDTSWYSDIQISRILYENNIWNKDKEDFLTKQESLLDIEKIGLYQNFMNIKQRESHKKTIKIINRIINELTMEKKSLDYLTLNFFAETIKYEYIIMNCILNYKNNTKIFSKNSLNNSDYKTIQDLSKIILSKQLNTNDLRQIAKSDLWRSYYSEQNLFDKPSIYQNDDQRHLIRLTQMYDSVKQHPEAPNEEVIMDDDALDGWFLHQKEKAKQEKTKNQVLDKIGGNSKIGKSGEVFVVTNDLTESRAINSLNDPKTQKDIARTQQIVKQKGSVSWTDLDHVIQNKLREQGKEGYDRVNKGD
jgi:hypothetical protein